MASGQAPELQGWSAEGKGISLAAHKGEPVLVYFWAEWCPICKAVHGSVESISKDHTVISVAMQSGDSAAIRDYQRRQELSFPAIPDPYGEISSQWGVKGVPAAFIIGANGDIRHSAMGFSTEAGLRARLWSAQNL